MIGLKIFEKVASVLDRVIDKVVVDKDEREKLKHDFKLALLAHEAEISSMGKEVILAEAKGGWLQRNWRPILMFAFIVIMVNNFVIAPYVQAFTGGAVYLEFPPAMWGLMTVGIGGYVGGRTFEKTRMVVDQSKEKNDAS